MDCLKLGLTPQVKVVRTRTDIEHAEALLHDIASELLRLPVHGGTRELHLRALRLKRSVSAWTAQVPDAAMHETLVQLTTLYREAHDSRMALRSRAEIRE